MVYKLFRKYQQTIVIIVTLFTIVGFASFYTHSDFLEKGAGSRVATIYDRSVSATQVQRLGRMADLSQQLGMRELYSLLATQPESRENFIFNTLVLKHEAEALGIEPTEDEVFEATKAIPYFQTNGVYDSTRYLTMTQILLAPRGFTTDDLSELIANDLRVKKIEALLGATVAPSESDIKEAFTRVYQKTEASVVRFKLDDFLASTQVPEEDIKKRYEEKKASLNTEERRKVKFVAFVLPKTDKPLEGKDRATALTELQKKAEDFAVSMADKSAKFDEVAAKAGLKVEESSDFPLNQPPEALGTSHEVAAATFKLTEKDPNSDVIETGRGGNGYYVLQLESVTPPRPLTFEEAKENIANTLKHERAQEALNLKAADLRAKIEADLKAGKSFADAAQAQGLKPEEFPAFSIKEPKMDQPDAGEIMQTATELNVGDLSAPLPTAAGSLIVYVSKRLPIDAKELEKEKGEVASSLEHMQQIALFQEWMKLRRAAAQVKIFYKNNS
jgi:peptidyl-prolyl cis-trans isomerase D